MWPDEDPLDQLIKSATPRIPASDPSNVWNAMGVQNTVEPPDATVTTEHPYDLRHYANQFVTGKSMIPGQNFDVIGENIKLQQNPALADKVALEIKRIQAGQPHQGGFLQSHVADWDNATNPNIAGGLRTNTAWDQQGLPMEREPIDQFAAKPSVVSPNEDNAITLPQYERGAATALGDIANVGFLGSMAAPAAAAREVGGGVVGRIAKSALQGAAINAPLSAADEAITGDESGSHLGGAIEGAKRGAVGGALLGGLAHGAIEAGAALPGVIERAPRVAATVGGAVAGGIGGATQDHDTPLDQLINAAKGAAFGGAMGHLYARTEGQIPGLSTKEIEAASERVAQAKQAALDFHDRTGVHPISVLGDANLSALPPALQQQAQAIDMEWKNAMGTYNRARQEEFRGAQPLKLVNEGPKQVETPATPPPKAPTQIEYRQHDTELPKDLTIGEPPLVRYRPYATELGKALQHYPNAPGAPIAQQLLEKTQGEKALIRAELEKLSPIERDQLTALTGKDYFNLESNIPAQPANFSANELFRASAMDNSHPAARLAKALGGVLKQNPGKTFQEVAASLKPEDRQALADLLGTKAYSASGKPMLALWSNPIGPAARQLATPLGGALGGAVVGGMSDDKNRVRGAAIGAAGGALLGTGADELLGGGAGSRALARAQARTEALHTDWMRALSDPLSPIRKEFPASASALQTASGSQKMADLMGLHEPRSVVRDMEPAQYEQFSKSLNLDNMEAEATRKQQNALDHQAAAHDIRLQAAQYQSAASDKELEAKAFRKQGRTAEARQATNAAKALTRQADDAEDIAIMREQMAAESRVAADNWRAHAENLRPEVDPAAEHEDWFQQALAQHRENIEPTLTDAALKSGVKPQDLRQPRLAYMKMVDEDRYRNALAVKAEDKLATDGLQSVTPRTGIYRTILGERPGINRLIPAGEKAPLLGTNPDFEMGGVTGGRPTEGQKMSGSGKRAEGSADRYLNDYLAQVQSKAQTDIPIGYHNDVYNTMLKEGAMRLAVGQRKAGERVEYRLMNPETGERSTEQYVMSPAVHNALLQYEREFKNKDFAGSTWKKFTGAATRLQVSGMPVEATSHANTETSLVGNIPGEKDLLGKIIAAVPGIGGKIAAAREMYQVNFQDPVVRALRRRIVKIGAARVEDAEKGVDQYGLLSGKKGSVLGGDIKPYAEERNGLLNSAHHWLFNLEGVDMRARLVLARKYLARNPHATDGDLARFINGTLGNYNRGSSGQAVNMLQDSGLWSFGRFNAAKLPKSAKLLFGQSGLPANSLGQRIGDIANTLNRGVVGYGALAQGANMAFTGHPTWKNEPGHHFDVQLPGTIGPNKRPAYLPFSTLNPPASVGSRMTGLQALLDPKGSSISPQEIVNGPANVALGVLSPAARGLQFALSGHAPYLERDGSFLRTAHPDYSGWRQFGNQMQQALWHANPATAAFAGAGGDPGHQSLGGALSDESKFMGGPKAIAAKVGEFMLPRVMSVGVGDRKNESSRAYVDAAEERDAQEAYRREMVRAPNLAAANLILNRAKESMKARRLRAAEINGNVDKLRKAFNTRLTAGIKNDAKAIRAERKRFGGQGSNGGNQLPAPAPGGDPLDQLISGAKK